MSRIISGLEYILHLAWERDSKAKAVCNICMQLIDMFKKKEGDAI